MFTFCPLQGALSESTASQSLLELDGGVKVLIDVGWDESFDVSKLDELEKYVEAGHKPRNPPLCSRSLFNDDDDDDYNNDKKEDDEANYR